MARTKFYLSPLNGIHPQTIPQLRLQPNRAINPGKTGHIQGLMSDSPFFFATVMGVTSIPWFRSYLSKRTQSVIINGVKSESMDVTCGVPHGSILGPQLFLLYINDLHVSVSSCKLALYADDSALIFSHKDAGVIANTLSFDLGVCKQCCATTSCLSMLEKPNVYCLVRQRKQIRLATFK